MNQAKGTVVHEVKLLCAVVLVQSIPGMVQIEEAVAVVNLGTAVRTVATLSGETTVCEAMAISLTAQVRVLVERKARADWGRLRYF